MTTCLVLAALQAALQAALLVLPIVVAAAVSEAFEIEVIIAAMIKMIKVAVNIKLFYRS
jgi:hypothetical protein